MKLLSLFATRRGQLILLGVLLVAAVTVVVVRKLKQARRKKEAEVAEISDKIQSGAGAGGTDIKTVLSTVGLYDNAGNRARIAPALAKIYGARGVVNDDEAAVYDALGSLDVQLLKLLNQAFQEKHGQDLDQWLDPRLDGFMSYSEYLQAVAIVRAKKLKAQQRK